MNTSFVTFPLQLRGQCPRLAEVMPVAMEVISETSRSVQFLIEGIFTHFFSPYRRSYHTNDVQRFMELANNQKHWTVNPMEHAQQQQVGNTHVLCKCRHAWLKISVQASDTPSTLTFPPCRFLRVSSACVCLNST